MHTYVLIVIKGECNVESTSLLCPRLPFLSLFVVFHMKCTYLSGETSVKIKCNQGVIFMLFFDLRHIYNGLIMITNKIFKK